MSWVEGACGKCGKTIRRRSPVPVIVTCDCHRYCPLCRAEMTPHKPDLDPRIHRREEDPAWDPLGMASKDEATTETFFACGNHVPPHHSDQRPLEVLLK